MAGALRGYCDICGKVSYASEQDAVLAAKLYNLIGHWQEPYFLHEHWHLRSMAQHGLARHLLSRRRKDFRRDRKKKRHYQQIFLLLQALIAKQEGR